MLHFFKKRGINLFRMIPTALNGFKSINSVTIGLCWLQHVRRKVFWCSTLTMARWLVWRLRLTQIVSTVSGILSNFSVLTEYCIYMGKYWIFLYPVRFLDSRTFVTCSDDTTVCLWDARFLKHKVRTLQGHSNWVKNIEYDASQGYLLTSGFDRSIYMWDINRYF